jgi:plasmid maintenance system antidote protein VapI
MKDLTSSLSKAFGFSLETWLKLQMVWDAWQARRTEERLKVKRFTNN